MVATFNRRETTLRGLHALLDHAPAGVELRVFLVDDGSTDGTPDAVRSEFGDRVVVLDGGDLFWAASMALAERATLQWPGDFHLWFNDDVVLHESAVGDLLTLAVEHPGAIVVGAVCDPDTKQLSYGGLVQVGHHPLRLHHAEPQGQPIPLDTFTGNVVLVPASAARRVGPIDGSFAHGYADIDYGLRASSSGIAILQTPDFVGTCAANPIRLAAYDPTISLRERWAAAFDRRAMPLSSQTRLYRRHGGRTWPFWLTTSYARVLFPRREPQVRT
jgi:GT2 family glycosyltransferase